MDRALAASGTSMRPRGSCPDATRSRKLRAFVEQLLQPVGRGPPLRTASGGCLHVGLPALPSTCRGAVRPTRHGSEMTAPRWPAKRAMDILGAAGGLMVLGPFLLLIALAGRRSLGSPVLLRQVRAGRHGRPFELLK